MIEQKIIKRAIIVAGENGKPLVDETLRILNNGKMNRKEIKSYFANLTIGAGAVAWSITSNEYAAQTLAKISAFSTSTDTSHNHFVREINQLEEWSCKTIPKSCYMLELMSQKKHGINFWILLDGLQVHQN